MSDDIVFEQKSDNADKVQADSVTQSHRLMAFYPSISATVYAPRLRDQTGTPIGSMWACSTCEEHLDKTISKVFTSDCHANVQLCFCLLGWETRTCAHTHAKMGGLVGNTTFIYKTHVGIDFCASLQTLYTAF